MKINFINVGYGDSILMEYNENGQTYNILVDGGKSEESHYRKYPQRVKTIDFLKENGITRIHLLVITHLHEDHVGGLLEVVKNIEIDEMWCQYIYPDTFLDSRIEDDAHYNESASRLLNAFNMYNEIFTTLKNKGKKIKRICGMQFNKLLCGGLNVDILAPKRDDEVLLSLERLISEVYLEKDTEKIEKTLLEIDEFINNTSIVLLLHYYDKKVLLGGDVYSTYWKALIEKNTSIKCDILKLPHHGHLDSVSEEFIKATLPDFIIISTSNDRPDNCPNPDVIRLFSDYGSQCNKKIRFLFTDAVHMPPYSTSGSKHNAVVFDLLNGRSIESVYCLGI